MAKHIAIVEDEPAIRENYADVLRRQGYKVSAYGSRPEALLAFRTKLPDLVVLDIGLQDEAEGGFELCRQLRALSDSLPIIFLTARESDLDAVSGLRLGADDYLTKDISLAQLSARIAALFRRMEALSQSNQTRKILQQGSLCIDLDRLAATWANALVDLTVTELWMTAALARHAGHVKTRDQLMQEADILVDAATVTSHIKRIRRKFEAVDPGFDAIEAVYAMGYRWKPDSSP